MALQSKIALAVKQALFATVTASMAMSFSAHAAEEDDSEEAAEEAEKVTIVGSRLKRNQVEGASPVQIITNEDMKEEGHSTVFDALNNLTTNFGTQIEGPEFSGGFTPDIQTLNIRGFGVGNTLTLINGRRVANYPAAYQGQSSAVNFGAIPQAAVERIEVLSGGGSSIYGSDAIAGVINIVLKKDLDDTVMSVLYGRPVEASGDDLRVDLTTGKTFDNGNFSVGISYRTRDPIKAGDYDDYDSNFDYPYSEYRNPRLSFNTYVRDWNNGGRMVDPGAGTCEAFGSERFLYSESLGYMCGRDDVADTNFRNKRDQLSVFANGTYQAGDVEWFGEFLYNSSESETYRSSIFIQERIATTTVSEYYTVLRSFYASDLQRSLNSFFEDDSFNVSFGARGDWGDHNWEASVYTSQYELESSRVRFKTQGAIDVFFGNHWANAGATPVWDGTGSFGLFTNLFAAIDDSNRGLVNSAIGTQTYGNKTSSTGGQFVLTGDMFEMDAGPVSYAAIAEYEKQTLEFIPDELITQLPPAPYTSGSGWLGLTGYSGKGDRTRSALGLEMNLPVAETVNINFAARVDNYDSDSSSIGTRVTPSLKVEWRPADSLLVRAGYSQSFRAPDLVAAYTTTGFYTTVTDYSDCYAEYVDLNGSGDNWSVENDCFGTQIFANRVGPSQIGNEPLKDETGYSYWAGMVYDITDNLSFTVDYSKTKLEDKVASESTDKIMQTEFACTPEGREALAAAGYNLARLDISASNCARVNNLIDRDPSDNSIVGFSVSPINIDDESVEGIDAALNYGWTTDFGDFGLRGTYSHLLSHNYNGDELRDDEILGGWEPRSVVNATLSYRYNDFGMALSMHRKGSITTYSPFTRRTDFPDMDYRTAPYFRYNLTATYNWSDNLSTRLSVVNLLDSKAPNDKTISPSAFPWYNTYVYGGAGLGRQVSLEASYTF